MTVRLLQSLEHKSYEKPAPPQCGLQFARFAQVHQRRHRSQGGLEKAISGRVSHAEISDANTILATIDSGLLSTYHGKDRAAWEQFYRKKRAKLANELELLSASRLSGRDARAMPPCRSR